MSHVWIVAEIGCNHNGSEDLAYKMVESAKLCGVDAVKFQTFNSEALISGIAPKADYQKRTTGMDESQLEMTKKLELSHESYLRLKKYAISLGLDVFSTPFDMESIDFLYKTGQNIWKIPSGEITNLPYLRKIGTLKCKGKKVILSTGMATLNEIENAINILCKAGTKAEAITILHCNTEYPTQDEDVNLLAISDLAGKFSGHNIGFSDHSAGYVAAAASVLLGVSMIEKHFTLDKNMDGPDHRASAVPDELKELVINVRRMEIMLGGGRKIVTESEKKNRIAARKSIIASRDIKAGEEFTEENLTCKRPGNGISPMEWDRVIGMVAARDFKYDELISIKGISWQEA